jgi:hypothetical protein
MKKYWFIIGLCLSLLGAAWLIIVVRYPVPSDGEMAFFVVRAKRGEATLAFCIIFLGLGLVLADAFTRKPQAQRIEREKEVLREEIAGLLLLANQTQQELNIHIRQVYGRTGLIGLELEQLRHLERHIRNGINASGE